MNSKGFSVSAAAGLVLVMAVWWPAAAAVDPEYGSVAHSATVPALTCSRPNTAVTDFTGLIRQTYEKQPELVTAVRRFPKGADLHNHLSGTVMPEDYLAMGRADGDCYGPDPATPSRYTIAAAGPSGACRAGFKLLATAGPEDRLKLVQSLSMYQFPYPDIQQGHDQFFATFGRFGVISGMPWNVAPMLVRLLQQADRDSVSHVETMVSFQSQTVTTLATLLRNKFPGASIYEQSANYPALYEYLLSVGLKDAVAGAQTDITQYVTRTNALLNCGLAERDPACGVTYAFQAAVNRNAALKDGSPDLAKIFTQTAFSLLLAASDSRVVGVNLLSGEDAPVSRGSFATQMQIFSYFHALLPTANIALHAGELTPCFVGDNNPALKDHLTGALKAGARRIGHGVSFAYLSGADKTEVAGLLKQKDALVEIMFTSNAQILGVAGAEHPFEAYRSQGVSLAFSTDDEGVSHADYTDEWLYGLKKYGLTVADLIRLARESLQHSFIPGQALWADLPAEQVVADCRGVTPGSPNPAEPCRTFLAGSARARAQWNYEVRLTDYLQSADSAWLDKAGK